MSPKCTRQALCLGQPSSMCNVWARCALTTTAWLSTLTGHRESPGVGRPPEQLPQSPSPLFLFSEETEASGGAEAVFQEGQ